MKKISKDNLPQTRTYYRTSFGVIYVVTNSLTTKVLDDYFVTIFIPNGDTERHIWTLDVMLGDEELPSY